MSTLFKRIYSLLRQGQTNILEDYLTEIFSEIFEDRDMLIKFFNEFTEITLENPSDIQITTQRTFIKLPNHETDSRPDLVIQFRDNGKSFIAFFENKLEAEEGYNQLKRYAEHLKKYNEKGVDTSLFYITRYHDPKEEDSIIQIRWFEIFNWLNNNRNQFTNKIIEYMEEIQLNETRRFLPQDIYAVQHMNRLQRMMDECLDGPVNDTMVKLFGQAIGWSNRNVQLRDHNRYLKVNTQDSNWSMWIGCGFFFNEDEYPSVSVKFEVSPTCSKRNEAMEALKEFIESYNDWNGYDLEDDTKWSGIICGKKLLDFFKDDDHIRAIQEFFIEKLEELNSIKQQPSDLNWKT